MAPVAKRPPAAKPNRPRAAPQRTSAAWSRTAINFLLDSALLAVFLTLAWVSVVVRFVFPAGTAAAGWMLWGYGYDDWSALQFALLCLLALGVLVHLMLHWSWVCGVVSNRLSRWRAKPERLDDGTQTLYGVGLLIVALNIMGLAIAAAALTIRIP
jgi:hypothetical protein